MNLHNMKANLLFLFSAFFLISCGSSSSTSGGGSNSSGSLAFRIEGENAFMSGEIGESTRSELQNLITQNPNVKNIIMTNVPGSNDDEAAIPAYSLIRNNGLNTEVRSGGVIASGGVDFFIAGNQRRIAVDAMIGVHAWSDGTRSAASLPRDAPEHRLFIDYYALMGLPDPEGFYFFTINAAPPEGIHYMTIEEINRYGLVN